MQSKEGDLDFDVREPWRSSHEDPTDKARASVGSFVLGGFLVSCQVFWMREV